MKLKTLKDIIKDANKSLSGKSFPIIFLDTSAVIDICKSSRNEILEQNSRKRSLPLYEVRADHFFKKLGNMYKVVVSPLAYSEMEEHYNVKYNSHSWEINRGVCALIKKFSKNYEELKEFCDLPVGERERYDVYWTTKFCCMDNKKKNLEKFSKVDIEILNNTLLFSEHFVKDNQRADPTVVFSSDAHILEGAKMLKELGYGNILPLSTRYKK